MNPALIPFIFPKLFGLGRSRAPDKTPKRLVDRVIAYRCLGSATDIPPWHMGGKIDHIDYELMAADNSCAEIKYIRENPGVPVDQWHNPFLTSRWFAIKQSSPLALQQFYNSHGTIKGGKTYIESALMTIPRDQYQVSPEEVVWHLGMVKKLKEQGISQPDRVKQMTELRKLEPWK